jgi:hypothetical protein
MSAQNIAIAALMTDEAVRAAVDRRIYAVEAPQRTVRPYLIVRLLSDSDQYILEGAGHWRISRVEVQCIADSATDADQLGEMVSAALGDLNNSVFTYPADSPEMTFTATSEKAGGDYCDSSADRSVFRRISDFRINWRGTQA